MEWIDVLALAKEEQRQRKDDCLHQSMALAMGIAKTRGEIEPRFEMKYTTTK
jgi:hypothetical protein